MNRAPLPLVALAMAAAAARGFCTLGMTSARTVPTSRTCSLSRRVSLWSLTVQQIQVSRPVMVRPSTSTIAGTTWRPAFLPRATGADTSPAELTVLG